MELDIDKLEKYDFSVAKKGDRFIIISKSHYATAWNIKAFTVKSVSPKRGDIAVVKYNTRFSKEGRILGEHHDWNTPTRIGLTYTDSNIEKLNEYVKYRECFSETRKMLALADKNLSSVPDDKLKELHDMLKDIVKNEV